MTSTITSPFARREKLILGVDLDAVVGNYNEAFRRCVAEQLGVAPEALPMPTDYSFVGCGWGIDTVEDYYRAHTIAVMEQGLYRTMPLIPGADRGLRALSKAGARIRIVTHRFCTAGTFAQAAADTAYWLNHHRIRMDDLCLMSPAGPGGPGAGAKTAIDTHINIDDAPHVLQSLRTDEREFVIMNQSYNQNEEGPRAHNWNELQEMLLPACPDEAAGRRELDRLDKEAARSAELGAAA